MSQIFANILESEPEIKKSLSFDRKDYSEFEKQYSGLIKNLEGYNPSLPANESKNKAFMQGMDDLIKTWGVGPIILYNEYFFKGQEELGTFERRRGYYEACDELIKDYKNFSGNQLLYEKTSSSNITNYYYNEWRDQNAQFLKNFDSAIQKEAVFALQLFVKQNIEYENKVPFYRALKKEDGTNRSKADCEGSTAIYIICLSSLEHKNNDPLFPKNSLGFISYEGFKYLSQNPDASDAHAQPKIYNTPFEATAGIITDEKMVNSTYKKRTDGDINFMLASYISSKNNGDIKTERHFSQDESEVTKYSSEALIYKKYLYLMENKIPGDDIKKDLIQAYNNNVTKFIRANDFEGTYRIAHESNDPEQIEKARIMGGSEISKILNKAKNEYESMMKEESYYRAYKISRRINYPEAVEFLKRFVGEDGYSECEERYKVDILQGNRKPASARSIKL